MIYIYSFPDQKKKKLFLAQDLKYMSASIEYWERMLLLLILDRCWLGPGLGFC